MIIQVPIFGKNIMIALGTKLYNKKYLGRVILCRITKNDVHGQNNTFVFNFTYKLDRHQNHESD